MTLAGHRLEELIGRGGMGLVYRATDLDLERTVALKVIRQDYAEDSGYRQRFLRESRAAAAIRHPNVVSVHRAGEEDGRLYITMDYVPGCDLDKVIEQVRALRPLRAVALVSQVASALDAVHAGGLVHRDVKPANVLLERHGATESAYLTDFGLAKQVVGPVAMGEKTASAAWGIGTYAYMAPEQWSGAGVDARTDVYALGCVLYKALTGRVPFDRESLVDLMQAHTVQSPPPVSVMATEVPRAFDAVVGRALAKDPRERYPSAGALAAAARTAAEGRPKAPSQWSVGSSAGAPSGPLLPVAGAAPQLGWPTKSAPEAEPGVGEGRRSVWSRAVARRGRLVMAAMMIVVIFAGAVLLASAGDGTRSASSTGSTRPPGDSVPSSAVPQPPSSIAPPLEGGAPGSSSGGARSQLSARSSPSTSMTSGAGASATASSPAASSGSPPSAPCPSPTMPTFPAAPTNHRVTSTGSGVIEHAWSPVCGADGYKVVIIDGTTNTVHRYGVATGPSFRWTGLVVGRGYRVGVRGLVNPDQGAGTWATEDSAVAG